MNKITERNIKEINSERRKFLDMLGKAGVSAGVLRASALAGGMMSTRFAEAAGGDKKFILLFHPNGAPRNYTTSIAMNPFKPFGNTVAGLAMSISNPGNHGNLQMAAGAKSYNSSDANSSSIDLQIAQVIGNNTSMRAIQLGVQSGNQEGINRLKGAAVTRIDSPSTALQRIFSGASTGGTGSSSGSTSGPTPTERKLSILDANKQGLAALRNKLGSDERYRLEAHLNTLTQLETRLNNTSTGGGSTGGGTGGGSSCAKPTVATSKSALTEYRMQGDIAVAALACGITNVASIQFNETQATWLPGDGTADAVDFNADHHQVNHGGQATHLLPAVCEYMNKGVANIIDKLKKAGIYEQTVILCVSEMGDGVAHNGSGGPIIVASGIAGLKGGNRAVGREHYDVFPDVVKLLGLQSSVGGLIYNYGSGGIVT
ncbi:MAG: hypothetical protein RL497_882 [Pseudomonadota bacterium]|jgi:hypothetical protein